MSKLYGRFPILGRQLNNFRNFRKTYDIEEDWRLFRSNIYKHKYKLIIIGSFLSYPLYKNKLFQIIYDYTKKQSEKLETTFSKDYPLPQYKLPFIKKFVVSAVTKDEKLMDGGLTYVENLSKNPRILDPFLAMMIFSISDPVFLENADELIKELGLDLLKDKKVFRDACQLIIEELRDPEIQKEIKDLLVWTVYQDDVKDGLVNLFCNGFKEDRIVNSMKLLQEDCFYQGFMAQDTVDYLRVYMKNMVSIESDKTGFNSQSQLELMLTKAIKGTGSQTMEDLEQKKEYRNLLRQKQKEDEDDARKNG